MQINSSFHERLRSLATTRTTPIIALTVKLQPSDRQRFAEMDIAGIIEKPFASETICEQIVTILDIDELAAN